MSKEGTDARESNQLDVIMADQVDRTKLRDLREWGTFLISLVTLVAIPIGLIILRNQRLEIEQEISKGFVAKISYAEDLIRAEAERRDQRSSIGEIRGKIDNMLTEQIRMSDALAVLKERSTERKP